MNLDFGIDATGFLRLGAAHGTHRAQMNLNKRRAQFTL